MATNSSNASNTAGDLDTAAAQLSAAAARLDAAGIKLEGLTSVLVQNASQGSGLGKSVASLTTPKGESTSSTAGKGIAGLFDAIFPRQASSIQAGGRVLSAGKNLFDTLTGRATSNTTGNRQPFGPGTGPTPPTTSTPAFPNPLPVVIVGGASAAAQQQASAAAFPHPKMPNGLPGPSPTSGPPKLPMPSLPTGGPGAAGSTGSAAAGTATAAASGGAATAASGAARAAAGAAAPAMAAFAPVAAIAATGKALWEFKGQVEQSTRAQLDMNRVMADLSPAMARVFADADARDAFRINEVGNRAAGSAKFLSDMDQTRKNSTKELDLAVQNIQNTLEGMLNGIVTIAAFPFNQLAKLVNKLLFESDEATINSFAEGFKKQAGEEEKQAEERRKELRKNNNDNRQ